MKACRRSSGKAPPIGYLGARWKSMVYFTSRDRNPQYTLNRRLGGRAPEPVWTVLES